MDHPDLDLKPSKNPFDKYPVIGFRTEQGEHTEERFYVAEFDLTRDDLGPRTLPIQMSEAEARARLTELGMSGEETEARIAWSKKWMATRILKPGDKPVLSMPPL